MSCFSFVPSAYHSSKINPYQIEKKNTKLPAIHQQHIRPCTKLPTIHQPHFRTWLKLPNTHQRYFRSYTRLPTVHQPHFRSYTKVLTIHQRHIHTNTNRINRRIAGVIPTCSSISVPFQEDFKQ